MNNKRMRLLKTITGAVGVNIVSMIMSGIMTLVVPRFVGVEAYSYWQLHVFYGLYMSYTAFGWNEGLYLKLGGADYRMLDRQKIASQFWLCLVYQVIINMSLVLLCANLMNNEIKIYIITITAFSAVIVILELNLRMILQATGMMKIYFESILLENVIIFVVVFFMIFLQDLDYQKMIFANVLSKSIALIHLMIYCRKLIFAKLLNFAEACKTAFEQIRNGIQLFLANISNSLVIGISRFMIEWHWGTVVFGEVSLVLTMSNLVVNCVNAISIVLFPILRRESSEKLQSIYMVLSNGLMIVVLGALCLYYPAYWLLRYWLPQYEQALGYFVLLLPLCVYDSKTTLLINTYLKTIRKEGIILLSNILAIVVNTILCFMGMYFIKNIEFVILGIVIALMIRCSISEVFLKRAINVKETGDMVIVFLLIVIFVTSGIIFNNWISMLIYCLSYGIYIFIKRNDIQILLNFVKGYKN